MIPRTYIATVSFNGQSATFQVADAGYGFPWAKVRAISHFFYIFPELDTFGTHTSFKETAVKALNAGLIVSLV